MYSGQIPAGGSGSGSTMQGFQKGTQDLEYPNRRVKETVVRLYDISHDYSLMLCLSMYFGRRFGESNAKV